MLAGVTQKNRYCSVEMLLLNIFSLVREENLTSELLFVLRPRVLLAENFMLWCCCKLCGGFSSGGKGQRCSAEF